ncbi:hypothetical protein FD09_GL001617 [Schleiferilactobacillus perolens DSM 12744]|uniref:Uncharacterized protein n=1 Tax=Schleiferilactobacillus perolens DSM 12744 TaxID=1423792 RepID=A0A0R1MS96_9LACO|nr:hypothetical protein FD09_GL001617 [Schleiferilactobacillus perolens DSM 12744]
MEFFTVNLDMFLGGSGEAEVMAAINVQPRVIRLAAQNVHQDGYQNVPFGFVNHH